MSAKFMTYKYVPLGFEMLDSVPGEEMGKFWNLWFNIKLTDDPEAWDDEIKLINNMQKRLGEITTEQRLIRAQMAGFCRRHPPFPQSIDILCKEIGEGCFSKPVKIGCEGRGLLRYMGYHVLQSLSEQRKEILAEYAHSLQKWLAQAQPETPTDSKVFGFLNQSTSSKESFVKKLASLIESKPPSISSLAKLSANECMKTHGKLPFFSCFHPDCGFALKEQENEENSFLPICCYFIPLDAGLLCAGTCNEKRSIFDEFIRFIEENILAYSAAINSWLKETPPRQFDWVKDARYVSREKALEITKEIHSYLGEKDEVKMWLAACLLKTIKDNKGWHKETELIDGFPEVTSWFRGKCGRYRK